MTNFRFAAKVNGKTKFFVKSDRRKLANIRRRKMAEGIHCSAIEQAPSARRAYA